MHRRQFIATAAAGASLAGGGQVQAAGSAATPQRPSPWPPMHLGTQQGPLTAEMLDYFKRHGVEAVCGYPPTSGGREYWTRQELEQTRDLCQQHGLALEMVALPLLSSSHIDRERRGAILLAQDPERTRDVEQIGQMIAACAQAGIPAFKYNLSLLGVPRTAATPGRGGARCSTWKLREAQESKPLTKAGRITAEIFWERITWFLDRMIPICREYKVRAACHPHDPGVPPQGFQEVYPDEGDLDMVQVARTLHEVGYSGMVMPDHMPSHPDDPRSLQAFAYGYGYIRGVLQAVTTGG